MGKYIIADKMKGDGGRRCRRTPQLPRHSDYIHSWSHHRGHGLAQDFLMEFNFKDDLANARTVLVPIPPPSLGVAGVQLGPLRVRRSVFDREAL